MKNTDPKHNLVSLLKQRSEIFGDQVLYRFIQDDDGSVLELTARSLELRAVSLANELSRCCKKGDRALLMYNSGFEFVTAFFGCMYAEVIAVPVYPPKRNQKINRLQAIIADASVEVVLATDKIHKQVIASKDEALLQATWINTEGLSSDIDRESFQYPVINMDDVMFLQYTSGSTGNPKGVAVTHENIMANESVIYESWEMSKGSHYVSWLPYFHDMGLIGAILQSLYANMPLTLMNPAYFLRKPVRWLRAISDNKATVSGGPNFAYDLCVDNIKDEDLEGIDLSSWHCAYNGAEPVSARTMRRFAERFEKYGLKKSALYAGYGMAETTLLISGNLNADGPKWLTIDKEAFQEGTIVEREAGEATIEVVSCGHTWQNHEGRIVNPDTHELCAENKVGELWFRGGSVAKGYWENPEKTKEIFEAYIKDTGEGPFLRTGDLAFMKDGQIYITGRLKDLLVIRGSNYYPQDLEFVCSQSHESLVANSTAAFSVETDMGEQLVIVQEVKRTAIRSIKEEEVFEAIVASISAEYQLSVYDIMLLIPGKILKTSSGKIQRQGNKNAYLNDGFEPIAQWRSEETAVEPDAKRDSDKKPVIDSEELQNWMKASVAELVKTPVHRIQVNKDFHAFGLDSVSAIKLSNELSDYVGKDVPPNLIYDYPTIGLLSDHLMEVNEVQNGTVATKKQLQGQDVAIVGMSCRFPGADDIAAFEKLLFEGVNAISTPGESGAMGNDPRDISYRSGYLEGVDQFDAGFFEISPKEAKAMDPQQRLLLELSYEAFQNAGYATEKLKGSDTGVFIGASNFDYAELTIKNAQHRSAYFGTGIALSTTANRLSYYYDFRGPSMAVDTACSSSLVAVHQAVRSIRNGESTMALAGGVNLILSDNVNEYLNAGTLLASDGHCKTFDAAADGYVRGEGVGLILLKSKEQATKDGDNILAVIKGSAVAQDGHSNGILAPNGVAQQKVIREAIADAGVSPKEISYIESHGTGTSLGDPIEVAAIDHIYGKNRSSENPLIIGSVKANIGHLEAAAGIAGLIKSIICLNKREIPKQVHFKSPNPNIDWRKTTVKIPDSILALKEQNQPMKAGVSSFGFGGTISHLILEEAESREMEGHNEPSASEIQALVCVSAKGKDALNAQLEKLRNHIRNHSVTDVRSIAYSLATIRDHFSDRQVVKCHNLPALGNNLDLLLAGKECESAINPQRESYLGKKAFLFTGGGSQYVGMCAELYRDQPVFKAELDQCTELSKQWLDVDLRKILFAEADTEEATLLHRIDYMQPALFAFEYAVSRLWMSWGVKPDVLIGHSLGEIVAACVAGVFSLEDGLKLICTRGQLMQSLPAGGVMISIQANAAEVSAVIGDDKDAVSIGVINGPTQTVISGEKEKAERVRLAFEAKGFKTKVLQVSHASHSVLMNPILEEYGKVVESITFHQPNYPLISNTPKGETTPAINTAAYWISHLRDTVDFAAGVKQLEARGIDVCIEVGPNPVLLGIAGNCRESGDEVSWLPSAREGEQSTIYNSVAQLYVEGGNLDWEAFYAHQSVKKVALPTYAFQRESYWINTSKSLTGTGDNETGNPLLGSEIKIAGESQVYESVLSLNQLPFFNDHRVFDSPLVPGAAFCEIIQGLIQHDAESLILDEISLESPLWLNHGDEYRVQLVLNSSEEGQRKFELFSSPVKGDEKWQRHAHGSLEESPNNTFNQSEKLPEVINGGLNVSEFYESFALRGMEYGSAFQPVREIYQKDGSVLAKLSLPENIDEEHSQDYQLHPVLLDGAFQLLGVLFSEGDRACLPFSVQGYQLLRQAGSELWAEATVVDEQSVGEIKCATIRLWDAEGVMLGRIDKLHVKEVSASILNSEVKADWLYDLVWKPLAIDETKTDLNGQKWLIISSDKNTKYSAQLAEKITTHNGRATIQTWKEVKDKLADFDKIINLWPACAETDLAARGEQNALEGLSQLKELLQLQSAGKLGGTKDIWWVTEGMDNDPSLAPLWGLGRVFIQEHTEIPFRLLDIDRAENILSALLSNADENQLRLSQTGLECLRLVKRKSTVIDSETSQSQLKIGQEGVLDSLELAPAARKKPGGYEVEIAVSHAGLNFRDVFRALNLIATDQGALGGECSGVVLSVGSKVRDFRKGDAVIALAEGSFSDYVTTDHRLVALKPQHVSFEEAATIPITFITAWYGLKTLANVQAGESILIHSAAGGVGMAAIQIAQHFQAEIYGTASLPKQEAVKDLGVNYIYDSRTLHFYDEIKKDTKNGRVDIVLNSFTEAFVDRSLGLLKDKGRFLEIGKRDIRTEDSVHAVHPNVDYTAYDLIYLMKNEQDLISGIYQVLMPLFESGILRPLTVTSFPMNQAAEAFKFMSQAKHTGKIVLANENLREASSLKLEAESTILLTGGLGGLGLAVADYLVKVHSIKHLALVGRKGPSESALESIAALEAHGAKVRTYTVDVTDKAALAQAIKAASEVYPLKGVFHLAGILDDGLIANQDDTQFKAAMAPKVQGGWNLHELTRDLDLDLFVLFSSAASVMGSVSQSNYAAGNGFLDSLAVYRRNQGLPTHSINWGPWSSAGLVHELGQEKKKRIQKQGLGLISIEQGISLMEHLVQQPANNSVVLSLNLTRFGAAVSAVSNEIPPIYKDLLDHRQLQTVKEGTQELINRLSALEADKGRKELEGLLQKVIAQILSVSDLNKIHLDKSLQEFGMDSLMAVELRNKLSAMFGKKLSVTLLFDYPNIKALSGFFWEDIISQNQAAAPQNTEEAEDWKQVVQRELMTRLKAMDKDGAVDYDQSVVDIMKELERMMDKSVQGEVEEEKGLLDDLTLEELEDEFEKELKDL